MKETIKRCFFVFTVCVFVWIPGNVSKAKTNEDVLIHLTMNEARKMARETAKEWADIMEPNKKLSVDDVQDVLTRDGSWEFIISYVKGKKSYGYASVVVNEDGAVVKKSVLDSGKETPMEEIQVTVQEQGEPYGEEVGVKESVVAVDDLHYAVAYEGEDEEIIYVDEDGQTYTDGDLYGSKKYTDGHDIYIKKKNWKDSKYKVNNKTKKVLTKFVGRTELVSEDRVENVTNKYACSIQSLMQIAYMERLIGSYSPGNIKAFYEDMWSRNIIPNPKKGEDGVLRGGTWVEKAAKCFIKYAVDMGYKKTEFKGLKKNPDIDWIRNKIEYNRPILFGYSLNGIKEGHMISILGVMKAKKVSSGNTWNYIMVYNAWNAEVQFINFDCVDFKESKATYFWVKK